MRSECSRRIDCPQPAELVPVLLGLVLSSSLVLLAGCQRQSASLSSHTTSVKLPSEHPSDLLITEQLPHQRSHVGLWLDEEASYMIKSVLDSQAEDHVHVIRWENCEVSGWTELDQFDGSEPVRQDLSFDARQTGSAQASFGWIIVVMRKLDNNPDIAYDVNVHGQFITMESDDSQVRRAIEPVRGKVQLAARNSESMLRPHPIVRSNQFAVALQKDKTGYPVSWLELRVVPSS